MKLFKTFVLLVLLACGSGHALAGPLYNVRVDTSALAGQSGYLDFLFLGLNNAAPAQAKVERLAGQFTGAGFTFGDAASPTASSLVFGNSGWNEAGLWAQLGGVFHFSVEFDQAPSPDAGTTFAVALLDAGFNYLGAQGDVLRIALQPGQPDSVFADPDFATVTIPEAPSLWLVGAGLALLGARAARRRGRRYTVPPTLSSSPQRTS